MNKEKEEKLKEKLHNTEQSLKNLKRKFSKCWLCGDGENLTRHHLQQVRKRKDGLGTIPLCKHCHLEVEDLRSGYKKFFREYYMDEYKIRIKELRNAVRKILKEEYSHAYINKEDAKDYSKDKQEVKDE